MEKLTWQTALMSLACTFLSMSHLQALYNYIHFH
jgi:hypothetical protein